MGLANMRVKAKTAKAPAMTADDRRKTLRPSSGGGGRRGPWGPKAIKYAILGGYCQPSVHINEFPLCRDNLAFVTGKLGYLAKTQNTSYEGSTPKCAQWDCTHQPSFPA